MEGKVGVFNMGIPALSNERVMSERMPRFLLCARAGFNLL
jgi:hypothetical protein